MVSKVTATLYSRRIRMVLLITCLTVDNETAGSKFAEKKSNQALIKTFPIILNVK
jgi:hypothetical protein